MTSNAPAMLDKAKTDLVAGRLGEARTGLSAILTQTPDHAPAHHLMGLVSLKAGDLKAAAASLEMAVTGAPEEPTYLINHAMALHLTGSAEEAIIAVRKAIAIAPDNLTAHKNLGVFLNEAANWDTTRREHLENGYVRLAQALRKQNRPAQAERVLTAVLERTPDFWPAIHGLITLRLEHSRIAESEATCRAFLDRHPEHPRAHHVMGLIMEQSGDLREAETFLRKATRLAPDHADAHFALGNTLLLSGRYAEGWQLYDRWIWKKADWASKKRKFSQPEWDGSQLNGRTLYLHADHGLGDLIQFVRFVPMIPKQGGRIILECPRPLTDLFSGVEGVDQVAPFPPKDPLPDFDVHFRVMGLATLFRVTLATLPQHQAPYLVADEKRIDRWRHRLDNGSGDLRVGLVWAGNPEYERDLQRSPGLKAFNRFTDVPGVRFFSLQKGAGLLELDAAPAGTGIEDLSHHLYDMSQTAAAMANMDLVISSCTAPLHLAGALGIEAWAPLPFAASWRWLTNRQDSPWYPSLRLFRQGSPGDWDSVMARIRRRLQARVRTAARPSEPAEIHQHYWPKFFDTNSLREARQIILTPTRSATTNQRWERETPWLLNTLGDLLKPGRNTWILDFGCGMGRMAKALIDRYGCWVLGVDISVTMRSQAEIFVQSPRFTTGSPQALDQMVSRGFRVDHAISVWTLQHCPAMAREVGRIQSALGEGGNLYVLNEVKSCIPTRHGWMDTGEQIEAILADRFARMDPIALPGEVFSDRTPGDTLSVLCAPG